MESNPIKRRETVEGKNFEHFAYSNRKFYCPSMKKLHLKNFSRSDGTICDTLQDTGPDGVKISLRAERREYL